MVAKEALNSIEGLPVMDRLDARLTIEELSKPIDTLTSGKAPGSDGISQEVIKCGKLYSWNPSTNCSVLLGRRRARRNHRHAVHKNKGERSDCNNYRGISLLSIVGKVFDRILLARLQTLAARIYPDSQCGFRAGISTIDTISTVRQIQKKFREQGKPLYLAFIDLTKAFDLVSRKGLFQFLEKIGYPPKLRSLVVSFHEDMKGTVMYDGRFSEYSFHSFCLMPSGHYHLTACTSKHELMANCSASHAFTQRLKCH